MVPYNNLYQKMVNKREFSLSLVHIIALCCAAHAGYNDALQLSTKVNNYISSVSVTLPSLLNQWMYSLKGERL